MAITKDRSGITKVNKERKAKTIANRLAKRKKWRLKKFGDYSTSELLRNSLNLFIRWGHRVMDCKNALTGKRFKRPKKKGTRDE
jgi:hypothetical protein